MFTVKIPFIEIGKKIILPISMVQPLERGDRLAAILGELRKLGHQEYTTILVCDYLNRFNCNEEEALKQGDEFLTTHEDVLKGFKKIRWQEFISSRQSKFDQELTKLTELSEQRTQFYEKIRKTWKKCFSAIHNSEKNSINYQLEEYAATLCMDEFDELIYPKKITDGLAFIYSLSDKKPKYNHIIVSQKKEELKLSPLTQLSVFSNEEQNTKRHVHIAFRVVLSQIQSLLETHELSLESKKIFAEELENIILSHGLLTNEHLNEKITAYKTIACIGL